MKITANDIDLIDAECFDSFSSIIFNCKIKYCCFNKKLSDTELFLLKQQYLILQLKMTL